MDILKNVNGKINLAVIGKKMYLCRRIERGAERLRSDPMNLMQVMLP